MAVVDFSADSLRDFRVAGLSPRHVGELQLCVHHLRIMRSKPPNAAAVRRALESANDAARRLLATLRKLKRPPGERGSEALAGFALDNELALADDPYGDTGAILDGNPIAEELAKVQRLCDATAAAIRNLRDFAPPAKKGGQPAWNATPAIYHALERAWLRDPARDSTEAKPPFLTLSHAADSPFRRVVDACYREAGRPEGVPDKAYEGFITARLRQKKELRESVAGAWDALSTERNVIRNE